MPTVKNLAKGVRFCAIQTDRFKTSNIRMTLAMPMTGNLSANALLVYVLKRSCKKYPDFALLNGRLEELYGARLSAGVSKCGEAQMLNIDITCIDDRFALAGGESISGECAALLAQLLFAPKAENGAFDGDAVKDEKRLMHQRMEEEVNDKRAFAMQRCEEILCENELYGKNKYGTAEELEKVTPADIYAAWQNVLKTATVFITAVGGSDGKAVEDVFAAKFGEIKREPAAILTEFRPTAGETRRVCERYPVNQGKLVMGFRTGMKDRLDCQAAEIVMNDLFGGNVYSKLFLNVREKLSLCYYCWAKLFARKGIVLVTCGIDTENEEKATAEILRQLADMQEGSFTDEDIAASKMGMYERYMSSTDSPEGLCSWYCAQVLDENMISPEEMTAQVNAVTKEQICAAAKRMALEAVYMLSAEEESK